MNKYLKQSVIMHITVFALCMIDMPNFMHHDMTLGEAPIIVDLSQVRIDEMTNLPAKAVFGDHDQRATVSEETRKKQKEQYSGGAEKEEAPQPEPEKNGKPAAEEPQETAPADAQPSEIKQDYLEAPVPDKKPQKKPDTKPTPKAPPAPSSKPKPKPAAKSAANNGSKPKEKSNLRSNALKSLMQEIDNTKNLSLGETDQQAMIKEGTPVNNMGIEGGKSDGSYFSDLTISEQDALASLLSQNWNLDPGAIGIDGMVVEIRVHMARDGSIERIEFLDMLRFKTDGSYRSVAESAQRAIIATQAAFKEVFGVKYSGNYDDWKTIKLYFDPLDKGVH